jgi:hypothetical protein
MSIPKTETGRVTLGLTIADISGRHRIMQNPDNLLF